MKKVMKVRKARKSYIMLAVLMVFAMFATACGGSDDSSSGSDGAGANGDIKIGIVQIVDHPSLNQIRDNVVEQLEEDGFVDGKNCIIDIKDGQNEQSNLKTICQKFVNDGYDIIIPIATPTAQVAAGETSDIPIVFSAVTDPVGAGLVDDQEKPGSNITGVSDAVSAAKIMDMAKLITPEMKTIGALYTSSETNSQSVVEELKEYAKKKNLKVEEVSVTASNEIAQAAAQLASKVDVVFSPIDNTVASSMPMIVDTFNKEKIPFYVGADSMVNDGGLATDGVNYVELGKETGKMAVRILNGEKPEDTPVLVMEETKYYYNPNTAKAIGIELPQEITKNGEALDGDDM